MKGNATNMTTEVQDNESAVESTESSNAQAVVERTLPMVESELGDARKAFEVATKEAIDIRANPDADFDALDTAMGKRSKAKDKVAKLEREFADFGAKRRLEAVAGFSVKVQDALRSLFADTDNASLLTENEIAGYNITAIRAESGSYDISAKPMGIKLTSTPRSTSNGASARAGVWSWVQPSDGLTSEEFVAQYGPNAQGWSQARVDKALADKPNLVNSAKALAKRLGIKGYKGGEEVSLD